MIGLNQRLGAIVRDDSLSADSGLLVVKGILADYAGDGHGLALCRGSISILVAYMRSQAIVSKPKQRPHTNAEWIKLGIRGKSTLRDHKHIFLNAEARRRGNVAKLKIRRDL